MTLKEHLLGGNPTVGNISSLLCFLFVVCLNFNKLAYDYILSLVLPCNKLFSIFLDDCIKSKMKVTHQDSKFGVPFIFYAIYSSNTTCLHNHNASAVLFVSFNLTLCFIYLLVFNAFLH